MNDSQINFTTWKVKRTISIAFQLTIGLQSIWGAAGRRRSLSKAEFSDSFKKFSSVEKTKSSGGIVQGDRCKRRESRVVFKIKTALCR